MSIVPQSGISSYATPTTQEQRPLVGEDEVEGRHEPEPTSERTSEATTGGVSFATFGEQPDGTLAVEKA